MSRDMNKFDREIGLFKRIIAEEIQRKTHGGIDDPVALVTALGLLCAEFGMLAGVEKGRLLSAFIKTVEVVYGNAVVVVEEDGTNRAN